MDQAFATPAALRELAPTGVLRAAINLGNFLLVTGRSASGAPEGVAPDFARAIADRLGVSVTYVTYPNASRLADDVGAHAWDIGLIGAEPVRAKTIAFTTAYTGIEATYLVPAGSGVMSIAEADQPGLRISVAGGSAYDLWLARHIEKAELVRSGSIPASIERFIADRLDLLAGLRPGLLPVLEQMPGARILDGAFTMVQQAVGTALAHAAGAEFLQSFVEEAKRSGVVAGLIARHGVQGLSVPAAGPG